MQAAPKEVTEQRDGKSRLKESKPRHAGTKGREELQHREISVETRRAKP